MRRINTLAIIEKDDNVLLAMKKRGFGEGWWNGYGGKLNEGEAIEEAMVRELREESGLIAKAYKLRGILEFYFDGAEPDNPNKIIEMHVFEVTGFDGEPIETEEMSPKWFAKDEIPYDKMWPADREWMSLYFDGHDVEGFAVFDNDSNECIKSDFRTKAK